MAKYRIKVEALDGNEKIDQRYVDGIECDGYALICYAGDKYTTAIHQMNVDEISNAIMGDANLLSAGILAKAKNEIIRVNAREGVHDFLKMMMEGAD